MSEEEWRKFGGGQDEDESDASEESDDSDCKTPIIRVENLETSIDNVALHDVFSSFGAILSCKIACDGDGKSMGSGLVHFESADSAKQARKQVHGMQFGAKAVSVIQLSDIEWIEHRHPEWIECIHSGRTL